LWANPFPPRLVEGVQHVVVVVVAAAAVVVVVVAVVVVVRAASTSKRAQGTGNMAQVSGYGAI
jgi:hypothetical protein